MTLLRLNCQIALPHGNYLSKKVSKASLILKIKRKRHRRQLFFAGYIILVDVLSGES
jgi:hypothetical protein